MRVSLDRLEDLPSSAFVLFAGVIGGVLQGFRELAVQRSFVGGVVAQLILAAAAVVLWWISVRRRRFSVWRAAWDITLIVAVAQALAFAFVITHLFANIRLPWLETLKNGAVAQLVLSPVSFVGAAVLLAVSRLLPGSGRSVSGRTVPRLDREAVT